MKRNLRILLLMAAVLIIVTAAGTAEGNSAEKRRWIRSCLSMKMKR